MKQLPEEYTVKGQFDFKYKIVKREGNVIMSAVYYKEDDDWRYFNKGVRVLEYEVFIVKQYQDRMSPDGKTFIPAKENPPSTSAWGIDSGSYGTLKRAEQEFMRLVEKDKRRAIEKESKEGVKKGRKKTSKVIQEPIKLKSKTKKK